MSCALAIIEHEKAFYALEQDWWNLWARVPAATPFQSPAWLMSWWRAFHPGTLKVCTVRSDGKLVGLAPFYVDARRALPIGISASDYLDVLIDPLEMTPVAALLGDAIADELAAGLVEWEMPELNPSALAFSLSPNARDSIEAGETCPVIEFPPGEKHLSAAVPAYKLRKLRMARRRAERCGGFEIEACHGPCFDQIFAHLSFLHAARWKDRGGGVLADERVQEFHLRALPELDRAGLLQLLLCRVGGRLAGIYHGLRHRQCAYAYISGFDADLAFCSPGTLLLGAAIDAALENGMREFHFLRGNEAYKYEWGAVDRMNHRRVFRPMMAHAHA